MNPSAGSEQLLEFVKFLRGRDIAISPADTLDAVQVMSLLGYQDREQLKTGLGAVLAKSAHEDQVYSAAFEAFFLVDPQTPEAESGDVTPSAQDQNPAKNTAPDSDSTEQSALEQLIANDPEFSALADDPLLSMLLAEDTSALQLSIETAARESGVDQIKLFTQRGQYTRKILDAMGEQSLREAAIALEQHEPKAFEEIQRLREQLRGQVRDRVERGYMVHAEGATEELLDNALVEVKLSNISPYQMARMRKLLDRMARKLSARHRRRPRKTRRGQLNVPATLRRAAATDGIPFEPRWRRVERRKPQIMAICDVSGSVATYAKFLLMFLYALQEVLPRTRSFAFSSQLGEVSEWFDEFPVEDAVNRVNQRYGGATDYGRALQDFHDLAINDVNSATTVIILGDARNNDADPRLDLLAEIKARCKRLIWLNPESRYAWGTGDSEMLPVIRHCHLVTECNNLKQLQRIVDNLLSESR